MADYSRAKMEYDALDRAERARRVTPTEPVLSEITSYPADQVEHINGTVVGVKGGEPGYVRIDGRWHRVGEPTPMTDQTVGMLLDEEILVVHV